MGSWGPHDMVDWGPIPIGNPGPRHRFLGWQVEPRCAPPIAAQYRNLWADVVTVDLRHHRSRQVAEQSLGFAGDGLHRKRHFQATALRACAR